MEKSLILQLNYTLFNDLQLAYCGYAECSSLHQFGPATRPHHLLHVIIDGKGTFQSKGEVYHLQKGEGFYIEPDELTFYQADEKDPWTYIWIGIEGEKARDYLKEMGLDNQNSIFKYSNKKELKRLIMEMLQHKHHTFSESFVLQGLMYQFLGVLSENLFTSPQNPAPVDNPYINEAISYIRSHYSESIKVEDIASYVSLNRSYLSTLFKQTMGLTLQDYIIKFRITRAAELLSLTDWSITRIADSCGYHNPLVFTKSFKKIKGKTPTEYRKYDREKAKSTLINLKEKK